MVPEAPDRRELMMILGIPKVDAELFGLRLRLLKSDVVRAKQRMSRFRNAADRARPLWAELPTKEQVSRHG